jgi:hypothetical protein
MARGTKTSRGVTDKNGMTIANSAVEGMHKAEALISYAANRLANQTDTSPAVSDAVSLSDVAVTLIEAKIAMAANASAFHAAEEMQKTLVDLLG